MDVYFLFFLKIVNWKRTSIITKNNRNIEHNHINFKKIWENRDDTRVAINLQVKSRHSLSDCRDTHP